MANVISELRRRLAPVGRASTATAVPDNADVAATGAIAHHADAAAAVSNSFAALENTSLTLSRLGQNWRVLRFLFEFPPLVVAELEWLDDAGVRLETAWWLLDQDGNFIGNSVLAISPVLAARMRLRMLSTIATREDAPEPFKRLTTALRSLGARFRQALLHQLFQNAPQPILTELGLRPGQDERFMVSAGAGGLSLTIDDVLDWPITSGDNVVASFHPGWNATHVVTCFAPLLFVELRHENGQRVSWVLDSHCRRIDGENLDDPTTLAVLRAVAPPMVRRYWHQILALDDVRADYSTLPMLRISPAALHRLLHRVVDLVLPELTEHKLGLDQPAIVLPPAPAYPDGLVLQSEHIRAAVCHRLFEAGMHAIEQGGRLTWPSPVDGSDATLEAVFAPQEYTIIYQFRDRNGLRFMVVAGERDCVQLGLYLPYENSFLFQLYPPVWWFDRHIPANFWVFMLEHVLINSDRIAGRVRHGQAEIVNVFMGRPLLHLGHYVWNDLTGLSNAVSRLGAAAPRSIIMGSLQNQAEFFGPIDTLFASMHGKVDRSLPDQIAFVRHVYASGIVPMRLTGSFVDAGLRRLVRQRTETTACFKMVQLERSRYGDGLVLMVGLRLEDRTFADNGLVYRALVDHLDRHHPGTILVLDGRNAKPGSQGEVIASIKDVDAARAPLEAELELVAALQDYARDRAVYVASAVGQSIDCSMSWCLLAIACFTPWGAGMAKYRWMANLPSVVATSRFNLLHRGDLDIYHSPRWMEDPSPLLLPDPHLVTDRIDRHGIAPSANDARGRECFEIDLPHLWQLLDRLLDELPAPAR